MEIVRCLNKVHASNDAKPKPEVVENKSKPKLKVEPKPPLPQTLANKSRLIFDEIHISQIHYLWYITQLIHQVSFIQAILDSSFKFPYTHLMESHSFIKSNHIHSYHTIHAFKSRPALEWHPWKRLLRPYRRPRHRDSTSIGGKRGSGNGPSGRNGSNVNPEHCIRRAITSVSPIHLMAFHPVVHSNLIHSFVCHSVMLSSLIHSFTSQSAFHSSSIQEFIHVTFSQFQFTCIDSFNNAYSF